MSSGQTHQMSPQDKFTNHKHSVSVVSFRITSIFTKKQCDLDGLNRRNKTVEDLHVKEGGAPEHSCILRNRH